MSSKEPVRPKNRQPITDGYQPSQAVKPLGYEPSTPPTDPGKVIKPGGTAVQPPKKS